MRTNASHHGSRAFTLVEILVSCALLAGLVLILASMIDGLSLATRGATRKLDAATQARSALNQIGRDLAAIADGAGATLVLGRSPSGTGINDSMAFLTKSRGLKATSNHRLLAVFYAVRNYSDKTIGVTSESLPILGRGFGSVPWQRVSGSGDAKAMLDNACAMVATDVNGSGGIVQNDDISVLAEGVIRMAVVLQLKNGKRIPFDPSDPDFPMKTDFLRTGISLPSDARAVDLSKISAICVGLAALDLQTRSLASEKLAEIASKLPRPGSGQMPTQAWDFGDSTFATSLSGVPRPVLQNLRFFQRTYPIQIR